MCGCGRSPKSAVTCWSVHTSLASCRVSLGQHSTAALVSSIQQYKVPQHQVSHVTIRAQLLFWYSIPATGITSTAAVLCCCVVVVVHVLVSTRTEHKPRIVAAAQEHTPTGSHEYSPLFSPKAHSPKTPTSPSGPDMAT